MSQGFSGSEAPPAPSVPAVTSLRFGMDTAIAGGGGGSRLEPELPS